MNYKARDSVIKVSLLQRLKIGPASPWTLAIAALVVLGTLLRFKGLTFQSLWLDELFSVGKSHPGLSLFELIEQFRSGEDPHPPLYFTLLHFWFLVFGYSEFSARAFSAACGSFGLIALYFLGKELANRSCALIAVAILVFNCFHLQFSQEVRAYVLMFAWAALSYTYFSRSLRCLKAGDLLLYAIISTLMIYTHYYGFFVLAAQAAYLVFYVALRFRSRETGQTVLHFFIAGMLICLLYLPWVHVIIRNMNREAFWAGKQDSTFFIRLFQRFFGEEPVLVWAVGALMGYAVIYTLVVRIRGKDCDPKDGIDLRIVVPMISFWILLCLFIPYYRSLTDVPMLVLRYEMIVLPAVMVLVSLGIYLLRNRVVIVLIVAGIVLASYVNLFHHKAFYSAIRKEQFREASCFVLETMEDKYANQPVVILSNVSGFYNVYFELLGSKRRAMQLMKGEKLATLLKQRKGLDLGVWVLSGHYKLLPEIAKIFKRNGFEPGEVKTLKSASATFYLKYPE